MSFFQSIKRFFGADEEYEDEGIDATVTPRSSLCQPNNEENNNVDNDAMGNLPEKPEKTPAPEPRLIFEHVVKIFNQTMPDFIAKSVDPEKQEKYLYETLEQSLKDYIEKLNRMAERDSASQWQHERTLLTAEIDTLKNKLRKTEDTENDWKNKQLSAERQKRALAERLHDLEDQISRLEAEQEQFELENKSLLNKIRVSAVQEEDTAELRADNESLRKTIAELTDKLNSRIGADSQSVTGDTELRQELEEQRKKNVHLTTQLNQILAHRELDDAMVRDLNNIASSIKKQLSDKEAELTQKEEALNASNLELDKALKELAQSQQTSANLRAKLDDAEKQLEVVETIQLQIEKFEEIKGKNEIAMAELRNENNELANRNSILEQNVASLKKTIEDNLRSQARSEKIMREEINRLKANIVESDSDTEPMSLFETKPVEKRGRKKKEVKISAIDESLDNINWLVATPPEGKSTRSALGTDNDDDFGYQAPPVRKTPPENDAQMSLW